MTVKSFQDLPVTPEMAARAKAQAYCAKALNLWIYHGISFTKAALRQCHGPQEINETRRMLGLMGA